MKQLAKFIFGLFPILILAQNQMTQQPDSVRLNEVVISANKIFGSKFEAQNRTGSSYFISTEEIKKFNYTDINRVLRSVPGVNVYEEDGFGLRPNISLRGSSPERSAKITIMEDGVLIAPAPYSSPSAYYFPSIARMQSVEILKGSSQVQFGPFTTGGAINLISTEVPKSFNAELSSSYGSFQSGRIHTSLGDRKKHFGYVIEYLNHNSNGFKTLPNGGNTGFDINDFMGKFRVDFNPDQAIKHAFELKLQYADQTSNETYLGITETDFNQDPFSRYLGSQNDLMTNDHAQIMGNYIIEFSPYSRITATGYYNQFNRNWYKADFITYDGNRQSIGNVVANPTEFSNHLALAKGEIESDGDDFINLRANNRSYYSTGVQTKLDHHWSDDAFYHDLEIGLRYHYDQEDRFQWIDDYAVSENSLSLANQGVRGGNANRISSANALATYVQYKLKYNNLTVMPGVRYENIALTRVDYGTNDTARRGDDLAERTNDISVLIPGVGFNYNFQNISIFGGVHRGFSPPTNQPGEAPEKSINYELGTRYTYAGLSGEMALFLNDYSNLLGSDLAATGGTGSLDQFNAGEVIVRGIELLLNYNFLPKSSKLILPATFSYTYTDTEFQSSFNSANGIWGNVEEGDELPYLSKHQFNLNLGLEHTQWEINLSARYNGAFRTLAGSGPIPLDEKVNSNLIFDFAGKYHLGEHFSITTSIINLLDERYAVSRVPAGLRPGHPFGLFGGIELRF